MRTPLKRVPRRKGFTLIELLIVILVLAILMAVALPLYLGAVADSQKKTCRANMQTIANAAQAYRVRDPLHQYPTSMSQLTTAPTGGVADLQSEPVCPSATGSYGLAGTTTTGLTITCPGNATTGHGSFQPGISHT